jgi:hypothetical protein
MGVGGQNYYYKNIGRLLVLLGTKEELGKSSCWVANVFGVLGDNLSLLFHLA